MTLEAWDLYIPIQLISIMWKIYVRARFVAFNLKIQLLDPP